MSIEGQHAYRFGYLKSEKWKTVRLEALAREKGMCQICGEESISNDAHHVWYPENIYETTERHLVILCRPCLDFLHVMLPDCKTNDEDKGREQWLKFANAIMSWRIAKRGLFKPGDSPRELRSELERLKSQLGIGRAAERCVPPERQIQIALTSIKQWAQAWLRTVQSSDDSDYMI